MAYDVILQGQGGDAIGAGHWMRLISLSRALTERGMRCALVTETTDHPALASCPIPVLNRLKRAPVVVQSPPDPSVTADTVACFVDDYSGPLFHADLVVHPHFATPRYPKAVQLRPSARFLMGSEYAILRPQFAQHRPEAVTPRTIRTVFVGCGGSRMGRRRAERLCADLDAAGYIPVLPPATTYFGDMASVMLACDAAITTASTMALEAMCLGLPLLTVAIVPEQELHQRNMASVAPPYTGTFAWDWDLAREAWAAVDGQGIYRVAQVLRRGWTTNWGRHSASSPE